MTPEVLFQILELTAICFIGFMAYDHRDRLLAVGRAMWRRYVAPMSSAAAGADHADPPGMYTSMPPAPYQPYQVGGMAAPTGMADRDPPDMDAPRISRYLNEHEILVMLAVQRLPDGGYRYSANKLAQFAGGDRNSALATIRQIRERPQYVPLAPDQAAARAALGLDRP